MEHAAYADMLDLCLRSLFVSVSALSTAVAALLVAKRNGRDRHR